MRVEKISQQHLVSQVVLGGFAESVSKSSGEQLLSFDLHHPRRHHKLRSTKECGWEKDFVAVESTSAEQLWGRFETRVHGALNAVRAGTPLVDPTHAEVLRDLVVLHHVRSYHFQKVYEGVIERAPAELSARLARKLPQKVVLEAFRETGLRLTEPGELLAYAEQRGMVWSHEWKELFRSSIEDTLGKARQVAATWRVEVRTPGSGEFLIGDNPGLTLRRGASGQLEHGMAIGDATSMVLPVGPRCLLTLVPASLTGMVAATTVEELNTVQVLAANRYVYMHRAKTLQEFTVQAAQQRPARPGQ